MKHLTCIDNVGNISTAPKGVCKSDRYGTQDCLERLYDYEKAELTPEQIPEMSQMFREKCEEVNRLNEMLEKMQSAYDNLKIGIDGCIKLSCKVGDTIYEPNKRGIISTYKVTSIVVMAGSRNYNWELIEGIYSNLNGFNEYALGKSVFLTQEEAEKKLAELQGEQECLECGKCQWESGDGCDNCTRNPELTEDEKEVDNYYHETTEKALAANEQDAKQE